MNCNRGTPVNAAGSTGSQHENVCSSCAFRIQPDARFCSHCGAKAEIKPTPEPEPEPKQDPSVICTGCGQKYAVSFIFSYLLSIIYIFFFFIA